MHIGVLFIAAAFQVRMKLSGHELLVQDEKHKMHALLDEIDLWSRHSKETVTPVILTCYDEIFEIALQRRFNVFRNDFAKAAEGSMIRFGLQKMPDCDAYMILSVSDLTVFKAEIFESLCIQLKRNQDKIIMAKYEDRPCLPLIFSRQSTEAVNLAVGRNEGKFVLRLNSRNSGYLSITKELLETAVYERPRQEDASPHLAKTPLPQDKGNDFVHHAQHPTEEKTPVVIIRGAGRIASSTAILLHRAGYAVMLTEKQKPDTIFRANTFAGAVHEGKKKLADTESYLVTLSRRNLSLAWKAGVIPISIDPDLNCLKLFEGNAATEHNPFEAMQAPALADPLKAYREEDIESTRMILSDNATDSGEGTVSVSETKPENPLAGYELFAVCDFTSPHIHKPTKKDAAVITLGIFENYQHEEGPKFLVQTEFGLNYSKISPHSPYKVMRIPSDSDVTQKDLPKGKRIAQENTLAQDFLFYYITSPAEGVYREIRSIAEMIVKGDIIGQLDTATGDTLDIHSPYDGRITGSRRHGFACLLGSSLAAISRTHTEREDCFEPYPIDSAIGAGVLKLLNESKYNFG